MPRHKRDSSRRSQQEYNRVQRQSRRTVRRHEYAIPELAPGPRGYCIANAGHANRSLQIAEQFGEKGDLEKVREAIIGSLFSLILI